MCCLTPFRSGGAKCRLLRPRRPSTAVDERERPTWRAFRRSFSTFAVGLSADVGNGELSSARRGSRRRHDPDGSNATSPLNCCRGGVAELFVFSKICGDFEQRARLRLILVEERGEAEHVQGKALGVSTGD